MVEEFALRFIDPLKYDEDNLNKFSKNPLSDEIVHTAIKLELKKVIVELRLIFCVTREITAKIIKCHKRDVIAT